MGINLTSMIPFEGQMTNAMKKHRHNKVFKKKEQDYTNGKWDKVEGAPGNLTKFVKNKK